jgi:hypothetical protein
VKNRAKCKLCSSIIESFHPTDHVICKCGEIELNGGDAMFAKANNFANFIRVDDLGNEVLVKYKGPSDQQKDDDTPQDAPKEFTYKELVDEFERLIHADEEIISQGNHHNASMFDLWRYMIHLLKIFKGIRNDL